MIPSPGPGSRKVHRNVIGGYASDDLLVRAKEEAMARSILKDEFEDLGLDHARLREAAEHHPLIRRAAMLLARRRNCSDAEALRQILRTSVEIRKPIADVARAVLSAELDS